MRKYIILLLFILYFNIINAQLTNIEVPAYSRYGIQPVCHSAYTVLYDTVANIPKWVAWTFNLSKKSNIKVARSGNKFTPDPNIPYYTPKHNDYTNSGYDRGHMCPANDCCWSGDALLESFYTSNICPQHKNLNRRSWETLEDKCHSWLEQYEILYIACGPIPNSIKGTIPLSNSKSILVPQQFFKVILGKRKNNTYSGIGFIFSQDGKVLKSSIDYVETITKYDFFPNLPNRIERKIEKAYNSKDWPALEVIR